MLNCYLLDLEFRLVVIFQLSSLEMVKVGRELVFCLVRLRDEHDPAQWIMLFSKVKSWE